MRSRVLRVCAASLPLVACAVPADDAGDEIDPPDEVPAETATAGDPAPSMPTAEGARGKVWVQTISGPNLLDYVVEAGRLVHQGDIDLGAVSELPLWGGAINMDQLWTNNTVRFAFREDFAPGVCDGGAEADCVCDPIENDGEPSSALPTNCVSPRDRIRAVIDELDALLPATFVEVSPSASGDFILIYYNDDPSVRWGGQSKVGMQGGAQRLWFRVGHANDDSVLPWWLYNTQPTEGTARHELMHAIGFWHEQSRGDRDAFIDYNAGCVDPDHAGNYEVAENATEVGPYDFTSITHYSARTFCLPWFLPGPDPDDDGCACVPMVKRSPPATPVVDRCNGRSGMGAGELSCEDINTAFQLYTPNGGTNEANDGYGQALAIGDFDDDGYDDLAVGVPREDLPAVDAGAVMLYKGTSNGLVRWRTITEASATAQTIETAELFGAALAVGDFDGDSVDDLAIGAPGEQVGGVDAGAVFVFRGQKRLGLAFFRQLDQLDAAVEFNHADDRFGAALAAGDFTSSGQDYLVVGAPGNRTNASTDRRGSFTIYRLESDGTLDVAPTHTSLGANNDELGAAFAVVDVDLDGRDDLVVGAPGVFGKGRVLLYGGREATTASPAFVQLRHWKDGVTVGSRFGAAIAAGRVSPTTFNQEARIAVGAPGDFSGRGSVTVYTAALTWYMTSLATLQDATAVARGFGSALAIGNVDDTTADNDLVIGAPTQAGRVFIARSIGATLTTTLRQTGFANDEDSLDNFGRSLAVGHLDGWGHILDVDARSSVTRRRLDLVVGAPGEGPDYILSEDPQGAGAAFVYRGVKDQLAAPMKMWHQELTGEL